MANSGAMNSSAMSLVAATGAPAAPALGGVASTPESAASLYDQYGSLAFSLAYRIVQDRGTAEEVVQDAFLAIWRNADRYDPRRGSMRTWLCRIVRNRALDRLRGTSGRQRGQQSLEQLTSLATSEDVVSDVLRREETRCVAAALAALPTGQRDAIELAYYAGHSQSEIASMTATPLGTVKGRTRAAMRALAASLASLRMVDISIDDALETNARVRSDHRQSKPAVGSVRIARDGPDRGRVGPVRLGPLRTEDK